MPDRAMTASPCILGVCLAPSTRRKCTLKEKDRIDEFCRLIARRGLREHHAASPHLARLLWGHMFDFIFRACEASLSAAWCLVKQTACSMPSPWSLWNGWADTFCCMLARFAGSLLVSVNAHSQWHHSLDMLHHNLRESWRRFQFAGWLKSGRLNVKRCELARKAVARSHALRV